MYSFLTFINQQNIRIYDKIELATINKFQLTYYVQYMITRKFINTSKIVSNKNQSSKISFTNNFSKKWPSLNSKIFYTYSLLEGSLAASSPSILYTLPDITYSKLSALDPSASNPAGFQSPLSGQPSSRRVVANTNRNLSPKTKMECRLDFR